MASLSSNCIKPDREEPSVNRWNFEYYVLKAFEAFRKEDYTTFVHFRNVVESLLVRPISRVVSTPTDITVKLLFMQFLSRINDGDKLGVAFENNLMPLESAMKVLESICAEIDVAQSTMERVHTSIREMLVVVCIKSKQFEKAQEMLLKHFPKGMDSVGKKRLYVDLIKRRCNTHSILNMTSYSEFKQDMLDFTDKYCHHPEPLLNKLWNQAFVVPRKTKPIRTLNEEPSAQDKTTQYPELISEPEVLEHHCLLNSQQKNKSDLSRAASTPVSTGPLSLNMLKLVYQGLSEVYGVTIHFDQLLEEHHAQQASSVDPAMIEPFLQLSETPVEIVLDENEQRCDDNSETSFDLESQSTCSGLEGTVGQTKEPQDLIEEHEDSEERSSVVGRNGTAAASQSTHAPLPTSSPKKSGRAHGSALSAVTVAQLVTEEDSQPSELEIIGVQSPSPMKPESGGEDPLSSLPVSSTPVRKSRRPACLRKSIPSEPEPASPQHPIEPQDWSTPSGLEHNSPPTTRNTSELHQKRTKKRQHKVSENQSDDSAESIVKASSTKKPQSKYRRKRWMDVSGAQEEWSDESAIFTSATTKKNSGANSSSDNQSSGKRRVWTEEESESLRQGVARYGVGRWEKIRSTGHFNKRTAVNLKDRWRTMKKLNIA